MGRLSAFVTGPTLGDVPDHHAMRQGLRRSRGVRPEPRDSCLSRRGHKMLLFSSRLGSLGESQTPERDSSEVSGHSEP